MNIEANNLLAQIRDYQSQITDSRALISIDSQVDGSSRAGNFGY